MSSSAGYQVKGRVETFQTNMLLSAKEGNISAAFKSFAKLTSLLQEEKCTKEEREKLASELLLDVAAQVEQIEEYKLVWEAQEREVVTYDEMGNEAENNIKTVTKEIEELRAKLESEKKLRAQKEEYAALYRLINQYQSRDQSIQQLEVLKKELECIEAEKSQSVEELDLKKKQFGLLFHSILQCTDTFKS